MVLYKLSHISCPIESTYVKQVESSPVDCSRHQSWASPLSVEGSEVVPKADCCSDSGKDRNPSSRKTERRETDYSSSFQSKVGMMTGKTGEGFPRWTRPASAASRLKRSRQKSVNSVDFRERDLRNKNRRPKIFKTQ